MPNPHHHHSPPSNDVAELHLMLEQLQALLRVRSTLQSIYAVVLSTGDSSMAIPQAVVDALAAVDKATNDVADRITVLTGQISTGMSQADVDSVVASLTSEATKLEGIAADPANPVPPTP